MFQRGVSGNAAGRPAGLSKVPLEASAELLEGHRLTKRLFDSKYWDRKYIELHNGTCNPKIEALLLGYMLGPMPKEPLRRVQVAVRRGALSQLKDTLRQERTTEERTSKAGSAEPALVAALSIPRTKETDPARTCAVEPAPGEAGSGVGNGSVVSIRPRSVGVPEGDRAS